MLRALDAFLNSDGPRSMTAMRIIEFNHLYGSNIRLFIQAAPAQTNLLKPQLQTFFSDNFPLQTIPGMPGKIPAGNDILLSIRVLLSDLMIEAFRSDPVNDETLLTVAMYLHLALLKNNKAANTIWSSIAATPVYINDQDTSINQLEEEYSTNKDLLFEIKSDCESDAAGSLPSWLQIWMSGYKTILEKIPDHQLMSIYRSTLYFMIKQLGITPPSITRLEFYIKKLACAEIINA